MATTPNYGWVTPAPTDFVTDLPADFETFADAVDADLAGLLGGTTGQYLVKDSNTDHDFSWTTLSTGGSSFSLLNTGGTALTGATTVTVSGISNKEKLLILIVSASSANASSTISIRFNNDNASNYTYRGWQIFANTTYNKDNFIPAGDTGAQYPLAKMSDAAGSSVDGSLLISGCKSSGFKNISADAGAYSTGQGHTLVSTQGLYLGTSAITSVSAISSTGNFDNGSIFVYGSDN